MDTNVFQQAARLLREAQSILFIIPKNPEGDVLGACGGLSLALSRSGKKTAVLSSSSPAREECWAFLPCFSSIFRNPKEVALSIACPAVESVRYEKTDGGLIFFVATKEGNLTTQDISVRESFPSADLLVTVGIPDRETLGALYPDHTDLFFSSPIINIDVNPANEEFGTVNLLSLTASSCSELVKNLLEALGEHALGKDEATYILFGLISATKNFQSPRTSPSALLAAASLIKKGANHQEIIRRLYKTKPFDGLKALGEVMQRLKKDGSLAWAAFTKSDLERPHITPKNLIFAAKELMEHFFDLESLVLLWERPNPGGIEGAFVSSSSQFLRIIEEKLGGIRNGNTIVFTSSTDIRTAEAKLTKFLLSYKPAP